MKARVTVLCLLLAAASLQAETIRIVAANLTSGNHQTYSPDNTNHSNIEGAGARILKALAPDIVLIQEFQTSIPAQQWVNQTLGSGFSIVQEPGPGIPNGILTRFPVIESGEWDDPFLENRDFVWALLALPDGSRLWAVSVHFYSKKESTRASQAKTLAGFLADRMKPGERLVIGGDLNTRDLAERCFAELGRVVHIPANPPADDWGNIHTNGPRNRPYDWVLVDAATEAAEVPVEFGGKTFADGLIFDTRVFGAMSSVPPAQPGDSAVPGMQHMAVARDFEIAR